MIVSEYLKHFMREDIKYWIAISKINGIGPAKFKQLYSYFDSMEAAWQADRTDLIQAGLYSNLVDNFLIERKKINPDRGYEYMVREKIEAVTILDDDYPWMLKQIFSAPAVLYYRGKLKDEASRADVAIVGTRKFSAYGKQTTEKICDQLSKEGISIVSGLALGIDAIAHQAAVKNNSRTVAVLGSGVDSANIYPAINRGLARNIIGNGGAILSEFLPGTKPIKQNFPLRNRIISGLSVGVIIIEAPESSGALLTARYALEQNREVMAVPGNIFQTNSIGPHNLIKMGAKLVTGAADVLEALGLEPKNRYIEDKKISADSREEKILLELLSSEPIDINELIKKSGLDTATVNSTIILMEIKGKIKNIGGMRYIIAGNF